MFSWMNNNVGGNRLTACQIGSSFHQPDEFQLIANEHQHLMKRVEHFWFIAAIAVFYQIREQDRFARGFYGSVSNTSCFR